VKIRFRVYTPIDWDRDGQLSMSFPNHVCFFLITYCLNRLGFLMSNFNVCIEINLFFTIQCDGMPLQEYTFWSCQPVYYDYIKLCVFYHVYGIVL
jgi:hypothetical protein